MLHGSERSQERTLRLVGVAVVCALVVALLIIVSNPFGVGSSGRVLSVAVETPYVGQGVDAGTAVVMHGVKVGQVTNVKLLRRGTVQLMMSLDERPVAGLTDSMNIDFRVINYFGVSGVNVTPARGGQRLRDGTTISLVPKGNFTLTSLLSQLGHVSAGALTPQLISVIDRATRYTDALNPLFETVVTATTTLTNTQRVRTARLLANSSAVSDALPPSSSALIEAADRFASLNAHTIPQGADVATSGRRLHFPYLDRARVLDWWQEDEHVWNDMFVPTARFAAYGFFAAVGKLLYSHSDDLLPLVDSIRVVTDVAPSLIQYEKFAQTIVELRSRLEKLYAGNSEERALRVRIVMDKLPGVAASMGVVSAPATPAPPVADGAENGAAVPPKVEDGAR